MKLLLFIFAWIILFPFISPAQKTNYDFASFTPPAGWEKNEQDGVLMYSTPKNNKGGYCLLAIYKSIAGSSDAVTDFNTAWNKLVVEKLNVKEQPVIEKGEPENGWENQTGTAGYSSEGANAAVILTNLTGLNNSMSILVITNNAAYSTELEIFFKTLQMKKPVQNNQTVPTAPSVNMPGGFADYIFTVPAGWKQEAGATEIVLRGSDNASVISILPKQASSGNLEQDMKTIFWQVFPGWQLDQWNPDHHIYTKGTGPGGWNYLKEEQGIRKEENGKVFQAYGFVMLVQLNSEVAIIAGSYVSGTNLLSEVRHTDWIQFFHSLNFKNYTPSVDYNLQKDIIGEWITGSSSGLTTYKFAGNGHYSDGAAFSTSREINDYHTLETTTSFAGDGTYKLKGNELTMVNSRTKNARTCKVRVYYQKEFGDKWLRTISMLEKSAVDGNLFELTMVAPGQ